ncbi:MAG: tRNA-(ms[2]io[6]A)-hydroxylase [Candidatus Kapaibacterium sp.]|jgi:tRNA-(ms[2]io[6]A)-hydroxylase
MLCLKNNTNPAWIDIAVQNMEAIMIDHAHCERKAASNGISMILRYPEKAELVKAMIDLVDEEMEHFRYVFQELQSRGITMTRDKGDVYAQKLSENIRKPEPEKLLDLLLVDALIEARSCERFLLLSKSPMVSDDLQKFYHQLFASEAGHYRTFTDIARLYFPAETVKSRLEELAEIEAGIVSNLSNLPFIHG